MFKTFKEKVSGLLFMAALAMIGMFFAVRIPIVGGLILSISGIPAALVSIAWGGPWFLLYSAVSIALITFSSGLPLAIGFVPLVIIPSMLLAFFVKQGQKPLAVWFKTVIWTSLITLGILLASNLLLNTKNNRIAPFKKHLSQQMLLVEKQLDKIAKSNPNKQEEIELTRKNLKSWFSYMTLLAPVTFVFAWYLFSICLSYIGIVKFSKHFGFRLESFPPFSQWKFDWKLIWLFISGWSIFNLANTNLVTLQIKNLLLIIGANCLAISNILFFIAGFSLLFFMFDKYKIGSFARIMFSFIALILSQAVIWFGIIDVWVDFRTPKPVPLVPDETSS